MHRRSFLKGLAAVAVAPPIGFKAPEAILPVTETASLPATHDFITLEAIAREAITALKIALEDGHLNVNGACLRFEVVDE